MTFYLKKSKPLIINLKSRSKINQNKITKHQIFLSLGTSSEFILRPGRVMIPSVVLIWIVFHWNRCHSFRTSKVG